MKYVSGVYLFRSSWDDKLVSKEIRSLDNTISMYNLMDVCLFCSQYFDPDFPDGIAYPTKLAPHSHKHTSSGPLGTLEIREDDAPPAPAFFDHRHRPHDVVSESYFLAFIFSTVFMQICFLTILTVLFVFQ
jgi:hypothetical protein